MSGRDLDQSFGGLKLAHQQQQQQQVNRNKMGSGSGPEILQGSESIDIHRSFDGSKSGQCAHPVAEDKGAVLETRSSMDQSLRSSRSIGPQWPKCPGLAWKALETMPVRTLFRHVSQSAGKEILKPLMKGADSETYLKSGDSFLDGSLSEKKLVTIVLAFQRWRHTQLKNIIGQELRKVLEEAREDETVLASLSTELERTEQELAMARANSSRLHSQLATAMNRRYVSADNTTSVRKSCDRQVEALNQGFGVAESAAIQMRDNQIQQLKEKLRSMEDQVGRIDRQLGCLQSERSDLQAENSIVLRENMDLLEQVSYRDKEMVKQVEEMKRLKYLAARLVEQQNTMAAERFAEANARQEHQMQQAFGANCSKEVELGTSLESRCTQLEHGNGNLLLQLQEAEERADLASTRAEELCAKLQRSSDGREDGLAGAASELANHRMKLTQQVPELESTISATDADSSSPDAGGSTVQNIMENSSGRKVRGCRKADRHATPECDQVQLYTLPQGPDSGALLDNYPASPTCTIDNGQARWVAWKWRWAASSARAELLARKFHSLNQKALGGSFLVNHIQRNVQELIQKLSIGNPSTCIKSDRNAMVADQKLVPRVLSAWRALTRTNVLERKAVSRTAVLDKILEALPWWIHKVRDRRQLERSFFQWLVLTLSAHRRSKPQPCQDMKSTKPRFSKAVVNLVSNSESAGFPLTPQACPAKPRPVKGPSDDNAVTMPRRTPPRTPAANPNPKRTLKDHRIQQPSVPQFTALHDLQTILLQEVGALKKILSQEIHPSQRNAQNRVRLVTAPTESSSAKQRRPDKRRVLKSVLSVCNNLAVALSTVKGKITPRVRGNTMNARSKLSSRVLADTVNSGIRSEQTKISYKGVTGKTSLNLKNVRRQGQFSPRSSPKGIFLKPSSTPVVINLQEPCSQKCHEMETEKTTTKDRCNNSALPPAQVQVQEKARYNRGTPCEERSSPHSSNLVLDDSFVKKFFGDGAKCTLWREKQLIESALARLVSTKISKLRGVKAA